MTETWSQPQQVGWTMFLSHGVFSDIGSFWVSSIVMQAPSPVAIRRRRSECANLTRRMHTGWFPCLLYNVFSNYGVSLNWIHRSLIFIVGVDCSTHIIWSPLSACSLPVCTVYGGCHFSRCRIFGLLRTWDVAWSCYSWCS